MHAAHGSTALASEREVAYDAANRPTEVSMPRRNPQALVARRWLVATILAALGVVLPSLLGVDGPDAGFAIAMISGFVAICGAVGTFMYFRRAAALRKLLDGEDLIAHWTYGEEQGARFAAAQVAREATSRRIMLVLVCVFAVPTGLVFFALDPRGGGAWVLGVMLCLCALMWGVTRVLARASAARAQSAPETWIGPEAVWVSGVLHTWGSMGSRLESATAVQEERDLELELVYSYPARHGRQRTGVRVPVPVGQEREGEAVLLALSAVAVAAS
jgi:hypothetical protein